MPTENIDYTDKTTGDNFTAADANDIKSAVNNNADELSSAQETLKSRGISSELRNTIYSWWVGNICVFHATESQQKVFLGTSDNIGRLKISQIDQKKHTVKTRTLTSDGEWTPDDHNTGSVAVDDENILVVYSGRKNATDTGALYFFSGNSLNIDSLGDIQKIDTNSAPSNYPNAYNVDDSLIVLFRVTGGSSGKWGVMIGEWPFSAATMVEFPFFQTKHSWAYITSRRNPDNRNYIDLAFSYHPTNETEKAVYKAQLRYVNGQWGLYKNGVLQKNIDGNAFNEDNGFIELADTPPDKGRLLEVHSDTIVIAEYNTFADGRYKMLRKESGVWGKYDIAPTGQPFFENAYFGGCSIDEFDPDTLYVSREDSGIWYIEKYKYISGQVVFVEMMDMSNTNVLARPYTKRLSDTSIKAPIKNQPPFFWYGVYDYQDFENFDTNIIEAGGKPHAKDTPVRVNIPELPTLSKSQTFFVSSADGATQIDIPILYDRYMIAEIKIVGVDTASSTILRGVFLDAAKNSLYGTSYRSEVSDTPYNGTASTTYADNADSFIIAGGSINSRTIIDMMVGMDFEATFISRYANRGSYGYSQGGIASVTAADIKYMRLSFEAGTVFKRAIYVSVQYKNPII